MILTVIATQGVGSLILFNALTFFYVIGNICEDRYAIDEHLRSSNLHTFAHRHCQSGAILVHEVELCHKAHVLCLRSRP